jgi:hypothetical protein
MASRSIAASLLLTIAFLALAAPAQAAPDVDALSAHAIELADEAQADPQGFAAQAQNPDRQRAEVDWGLDWGCGATADVAPVADALEEQGVCRAAADVAAGAHEHEQIQGADVQPIDAPQAAVADELAAAQDLAGQVVGDPTSAPGALQEFVARTLDALSRLLGAPGAAFDALKGAFDAAAGALAQVGAAIGGGAGQAMADAGASIAGAGKGVVDTVAGAVDGVAEAVAHLLQGAPRGASAPKLSAPAVPRAVPRAEGLLPSLPLRL